ncbi:uncharacterized protein (TIGR02594 family) [Ancylobacter sp. 3268]|uniref:TIGR02594 family protein n=1 Tax=Ancylobacter sp. 3268 TaxID=2817752 RepID=UPI00285DBFD8|nr:TIGR02594 family protein [Ancylobacter sp. 3268]MDR6952293.1 uncharacterized protein (TIGR02594 family) [Ancylobacter sp. 3268]
MAAAERNVNVRLAVLDGGKVKAELQAVGNAGSASMDALAAKIGSVRTERLTSELVSAEKALRSLGAASAPVTAQLANIGTAEAKLRSMGQAAADATRRLDELRRSGDLAMARLTGTVEGMAPGLLASRNSAAQSALSSLGSASAPFAAQMSALDRANAQLRGLGGASKQAMGEVEASTKLANHEIGLMGAQFMDLGTQIAAGGGLFLPIIQQGGQLAGQLGDRGLKGAVSALGEGLLAFVTNPVNLAVLGFATVAAGAAYFFSEIEDGGKSAEDVLKEHEALVGRIRDRYGEAQSSLREYVNESDRLQRREAERNLSALRGQLSLQADSVVSQLGLQTRPSAPEAFGSIATGFDDPVFVMNDRYAAFRQQIDDLQKSVAAGNPRIVQFREEVAKLAEAKPNLRPIADELLKITDAASQTERSLPGAKAAIDAVADAARDGVPGMRSFRDSLKAITDYVPELQRQRQVMEDLRIIDGNLRNALEKNAEQGGSEGAMAARAAALEEAARRAREEVLGIAEARRSAEAHDLDMRAINARTVAQRAAIAADRARADALKEAASAADADAAAQRAVATVYAEAARQQQDAEIERSLSIQERFAASRLELQSISSGIAESEKLRYALEAEAQARREAWQETGSLSISADRIRQIKAEAEAWGQLQEAISRARLQQDLIFERQQLGRSDIDQQVYGTMRSAGLLDANNEIVGAQNQAIAKQIELNAKVAEMQDLWRGTGQQIASAFLNGGDVGAALLDRVKSVASAQIGKTIDDGISKLISGAMPGLVPGLAKSGPLGSSSDNAMWVRFAEGSIPAGLIGSSANDNIAGKAAGGGIGSDHVAGGDSMAGVLSLSKSYEGLNERRDNAALSTLLSASGTAKLNPADQAWCAAYANAVLAKSGLTGTGSNLASSFQSWGQATSNPQLGDIVNLSPQAAGASGHVGFFAGMQGNSVLVSGGNQGNGVSTAAFPMSDVVSFRTATTEIATASTAMADATKSAASAAGDFSTGLGDATKSILGGLGQAGTTAAGATAGGGLGGLGSLFSGVLGIVGKIFGFDEGGYTGGKRGKLAGMVHGEEFVFDATATANIGADRLEAIHQMAKQGRRVTASPLAALATQGNAAATAGTAGQSRGKVEMTINLAGANGDETIARISRAAAEQALAEYDANLLPNIEEKQYRAG